MDAGINLRNKTQGQKSDAQSDDKNRLRNTAGKNGTSHGIGYAFIKALFRVATKHFDVDWYIAL